MDLNTDIEKGLDYANQRREPLLAELKDFLAIPSVGTQPQRADDMMRAAKWLTSKMERAGLENVRVINTARHPLVYGDWLRAGKTSPTVLVYGHYDVQPGEPESAWRTPPFVPDVRDDFIYARGAADDKGQFLVQLNAAEALIQGAGGLPVNLKFIVEGEEEEGGASLTAFVAQNPELLSADVVLMSDSAMLSPEQPVIISGVRGLSYFLVDVMGPDRDLHSGMFGGAINNPVNVLARIIARLQDDDGHILIPGFYDSVRALDDEERERLAAFPLDDPEWLERSGAPELWGERGYSFVERVGARPSLDVNGITGGYTGEGGKTIIPSSAHAKISMRLVPDQEPKEIVRLFHGYVAELTPDSVRVTISELGQTPASVIDVNSDAVRAAAAAYKVVFGAEPVYERSGGTLPVVGDFQRYLGIESVLMGFGLPGDNIHSPNERFYLPHFYRGIEAVIRFYFEYAGRYTPD